MRKFLFFIGGDIPFPGAICFLLFLFSFLCFHSCFAYSQDFDSLPNGSMGYDFPAVPGWVPSNPTFDCGLGQNLYCADNGFVVGSSVVRSGSKSVNLTDSTFGGQTFTWGAVSQSQSVNTIEFSYYPTAGDFTLFLVTSPLGSNVSSFGFDVGSDIIYPVVTSPMWGDPVKTLSPDTWYDIKLVFSTSSDSFDIVVDNNEVYSGSLPSVNYNAQYFYIGAFDSEYLDDFKFNETGFSSEPVASLDDLGVSVSSVWQCCSGICSSNISVPVSLGNWGIGSSSVESFVYTLSGDGIATTSFFYEQRANGSWLSSLAYVYGSSSVVNSLLIPSSTPNGFYKLSLTAFDNNFHVLGSSVYDIQIVSGFSCLSNQPDLFLPFCNYSCVDSWSDIPASLNCIFSMSLRRSVCVSTSSIAYFEHSFDRLDTVFPLNLYWDLDKAFTYVPVSSSVSYCLYGSSSCLSINNIKDDSSPIAYALRNFILFLVYFIVGGFYVWRFILRRARPKDTTENL